MKDELKEVFELADDLRSKVKKEARDEDGSDCFGLFLAL